MEIKQTWIQKIAPVTILSTFSSRPIKQCTCSEAFRCFPNESEPIAHDSVKRLLEQQPHHTEALYIEQNSESGTRKAYWSLTTALWTNCIHIRSNWKPVNWSGKHHRVVQGINLIWTIWTNRLVIVPVEFPIYPPDTDGKNKSDHFRDIIRAAEERQFRSNCVLSTHGIQFSIIWSWSVLWNGTSAPASYPTGLWIPITPINLPISEIDIPPEGKVVHLRQYGFIKVFRVVHSDRESEHWATDILHASESDRKSFKDLSCNIESYHRWIKQSCGVERCQGRKKEVQQGYIFLALHAFLPLESNRLKTGTTWYELKRAIQRSATTLFVVQPAF